MNEYGYIWQEVECFCCDHRFTALLNGFEQERAWIRGSDTEYSVVQCPKCGERLLVSRGNGHSIAEALLERQDAVFSSQIWKGI